MFFVQTYTLCGSVHISPQVFHFGVDNPIHCSKVFDTKSLIISMPLRFFLHVYHDYVFLNPQEFKITRLTAVPSLIRALLPALQSRCHQLQTLLRVLVLSGEPLPREVWRQLQSILGDTTILNLYGSTEVRYRPFKQHEPILK